ncbi:MAG: ABC transporter permease [Pseudomonadota bacterium]|nr:ABC transporter permease [Pseudomonadota bacterium]
MVLSDIQFRSLQAPRFGFVGRLASAILPPVAAVVLALAVSAALLQISGFHAADVVNVMVVGAFADERSISEVLLKATPLILIGVGLCVAFRCSIWNIGAEGQLYAGACAATVVGVHFAGLPTGLHIALILIAGTIAGALWAALAGLLRVYFRASEVVTTIMLNYIAIIFTSYLVTGPLKDPVVPYPQSAKIARELWLPRILPPTRLHLGILIAVAAAGAVYVFLFRSSAGYAVRVVGLNPRAAAYAGVNVAKNVLLAIAISGGLAGLAGAIEIDGVNYRLYQDISPGYGFEGIAVALLANNNPLAAIASGILFAALRSGSEIMQISAQVPQVLVFIIQGLVILSIVAFAALRHSVARPAD